MIPQRYSIPYLIVILNTPSPKERSGPILPIPPRRVGGSINAISAGQQRLPLVILYMPPHGDPVMPVLCLVLFIPYILGPIPKCYLLMFHSEMVFIDEPSKKTAPHFHFPETQRNANCCLNTSTGFPMMGGKSCEYQSLVSCEFHK
jgi:hypothetical protein